MCVTDLGVSFLPIILVGSNMDIQYALIIWASWVKQGRTSPATGLQSERLPGRLKNPEKSLPEVVDAAVRRLPENLRQTITVHYLEGQSGPCIGAIGKDRVTFQRRIGFAEHLIASTIFED